MHLFDSKKGILRPKSGLIFNGAKRIGIMTPFDKKRNESATQMFEELGF